MRTISPPSGETMQNLWDEEDEKGFPNKGSGAHLGQTE
jgi:hypothetical protein